MASSKSEIRRLTTQLRERIGLLMCGACAKHWLRSEGENCPWCNLERCGEYAADVEVQRDLALDARDALHQQVRELQERESREGERSDG